ncbi:MAG: hypothetical protein RIR00_2432 [Pseudomonadota bacterium]|jgi:murein DD-endopeptidase MepM/ murein hydrolase activator NlpD
MQKSRILAQSYPLFAALLHEYRTPIAVASFTALSVVTAFAVMPEAPESKLNIDTVVEQLNLQGSKPLDPSGTFLREERIRSGDSLGSLLSRLGITDREGLELIRQYPQTQVMHRQLVPGKLVTAQTSETGMLFSLNFPLNKETVLVVERVGARWHIAEEALRYESYTVMKSGEINSSLFAATDIAGIPDSIASQMADIFGGEIDFHRDLRRGDRFHLIYEMQYQRGQAARSGKVLAAEFSNNGKTFRAVHFEQDGRGGYYSPDGKSLRKAFLRSPLEFSRVTSGFSMRFHPILQQWRQHKGVDYGAPSGTKVRSTGDGIVDFAGRQGGYGNLIVVRHPGRYSTAYGHLQGFASGIHKGSRISQGDTLGYVGATGWATGPHLHYEFRVSDQPVNPLSVTLPTSVPLEAHQLKQFRSAAAPLLDQMNLLRQSNFAAIE